MTELRLAAVNGEQTIPVGFDPFVASFVAIADKIAGGEITLEKAILVTIIDGHIGYTPVGKDVPVLEAIGLLHMAAGMIERGVHE